MNKAISYCLSHSVSNISSRNNFDVNLERFLNVACIWSAARDYLQSCQDGKNDLDKSDKIMLNRFCDSDTAIALALIIKRYRDTNLPSYSYRGLSKEMHINVKSRKIKNIVEASEHFGMLCVFKSKHHITGEVCSNIVPTFKLIALFRNNIFPNLNAELS